MHRPLIAAAASEDAEAVVALWRDCGLTRPWNDPHADFALALRSESSTVLIARDGEGVEGTVMVGFDGHRGWVYYLAVSAEHRGAGLGRALMGAAEDWLRARGAPKLQLMVREDNHAALGFYEALGLKRQKVVTLGRFLGAGMTVTMYGIKNCDTIKKARAWLDEHAIAYAFHDYKIAGADSDRLARWIAAEGWEALLNRAGTTFRKLSDADKADLDVSKATALMLAQPSMIKRPVLEYPGGLLIGFVPERYARALL